jgi:serine/threonine-protein kinase
MNSIQYLFLAALIVGSGCQNGNRVTEVSDGLSDSLIKAYQAGDFERALEFADEWVAADSNHAIAFTNRSAVKIHLQDYQGAYEDADKAIQLDSLMGLAFYNRGSATFNLNEPEESLKDFNKSVELSPEYAATYFDRGLAKNEIGDYHGAFIDFSEAISLDSSMTKAYFRRGVSKIKLELYYEAIQDFNAVENKGWLEGNGELEVRKKMPVHGNRGFAKAQIGDYGGAIFDFDIALSADSRNSLLYRWRAIAKSSIGDEKGACEDWRKVYELGSDEGRLMVEKHCN